MVQWYSCFASKVGPLDHLEIFGRPQALWSFKGKKKHSKLERSGGKRTPHRVVPQIVRVGREG